MGVPARPELVAGRWGRRRSAGSLEEVAAQAYLSPSRLRHLVKEVTGVGFREYLANLRLAEAKRMLLCTDAPIAEVAREVSYTNLHQFYTVFHRYCGMSPAAYRRQYTPVGARLAVADRGELMGAVR
jgi:AraC-like DNA-binding protein